MATLDLARIPPDPTLTNDLVLPLSTQYDSTMAELEILPMEDCDASSGTAIFETLLVRSLSRPALRMLWHQRLGHLNFRRLSTMHRFVKGMPEFAIPNALEE